MSTEERKKRLTDEELLDALIGLFRKYGYAGTTLTRISEATGLGRASLYHRFPDGKAGMADAVVRYAVDWLHDEAFAPLQSDAAPLERLRAMTEKVSELYDRGRRSCLFETLSLDEPHSPVHDQVKAAVSDWIAAVEKTLLDGGLPPKLARARAEELVVRIQGSLVVARTLGDPGIYRRTVSTLAADALRGA